METSEAVNTYLGLDGDEQGMVERFFANLSTDTYRSFIRYFIHSQTNNN